MVEMVRGIKAGIVAGLAYGISYAITVPVLFASLASLFGFRTTQLGWLGAGYYVQLRANPFASLIVGPIFGVTLGLIYALTYALLPGRRIARISESETKGLVLGFVVWLIPLALQRSGATLFFSEIEGAASFQMILTAWSLVLFLIMGVVLGNVWNRFKPKATQPPSAEIEPSMPSAERRRVSWSEMRFCPNCGNELPPASAFCPNCGRPIATPMAPPTKPPAEKVSDLWYLLPFFLTWLGGLIAYFATKSRDPAKARKMLIFGVVWTILLALGSAAFYATLR